MREADLIRLLRNVIYCGKLREGEQFIRESTPRSWMRISGSGQTQPSTANQTSARAEARSRCPGATPERSGGTTESASVPRISRLLALALRMEQMIEEGRVKKYSELAQLGQVSTARITQIMNLLHLAPDIQEQILSPDAAQVGLREAAVRKLCSVVQWAAAGGRVTISWNSRFSPDSRIGNRDIEMGTRSSAIEKPNRRQSAANHTVVALAFELDPQRIHWQRLLAAAPAQRHVGEEQAPNRRILQARRRPTPPALALDVAPIHEAQFLFFQSGLSLFGYYNKCSVFKEK